MSTSSSEARAKRIVVGVDGSAESRAALRWALRLAPALGCEVAVITAWHHPTFLGLEGDATPEEFDPATIAEAELDEVLRDVLGDALPAHVSAGIRHGQTTGVLLDESRDAAMLVLGSRGRGGFTGMLLGSVSAACAEHANCPVLVVHGEADLPA